MRALAALALSVLFGSSALACVTGANAVEMQSESVDAPRIYIDMPSPPLSAPFSAEVTLCGLPDGNIPAFDATMPAHQHGMNYEPQVTAVGLGRYAIRNIVFHMPGLWRLTVEIGRAEGSTVYSADVMVD